MNSLEIEVGKIYINLAGDQIIIVAKHPYLRGIYVGVNTRLTHANTWYSDGALYHPPSAAGGSPLIKEKTNEPNQRPEVDAETIISVRPPE